MSNLLTDFRNFFRRYEAAWNECDASFLKDVSASDLIVRWAYPGNQTSDWGCQEACDGWRQAFSSYEGRNPQWTFHEVRITPVNDAEVLAVFWVTFEVDGKPTKEINLFVETFRKEPHGWVLIRSYVESSMPRQYVNI